MTTPFKRRTAETQRRGEQPLHCLSALLRSPFRNFLFAIFTFIALSATAQTSKEVSNWFKKATWAPANLPKPHKTIDKQVFYEQYRKNKILWDSAFQFLTTRDLSSLAPGKYPIIGERVFATITEAPTRDKDSVKWESHRKYIDLHYIIRGKELIGLSDTTHSVVTKLYEPDAQNYTTQGKYHLAEPGTFFLIFPNDVHCATIRSGDVMTEKKLVIKIEMAWPDK
jgi:YhcH/YjgK/YiaL family protein